MENAQEVNAAKIEHVPTGKLIPYANNSRTHSPPQIAQIAASIREFGFTNPILVSDDLTIIAGHGRVKAAQTLNLSEVPCIKLSHLNERQRRAYVIADNRLALSAGWDDEILALELEALKEEGFDLDLLGFDDAEMRALLEVQRFTEEDDAALPDEASSEAVTMEGDLWLLGESRIVCGSSTSADVVERLFAGEKPCLMVTDPPYGVQYDASWRDDALGEGNRATSKVQNDDLADWSEAWALFPGDVAYVWHASAFTGLVQGSLERCGLEFRSHLIWAKSRFAISRAHYHWRHETCLYVARKGRSAKWIGGRSQSTLWEIDVEKCDTGHSTQKPLECMLRPIRNHSFDLVYDPFLGSGTTVIAAESIGRRALGCELKPIHVDMAVRRWQRVTGKDAILQGDGRTFDEVARERAGGSSG